MDCGSDLGDEGSDFVVLSSSDTREMPAAFPDAHCDGVLQGALLGCGGQAPSSQIWWLISLYLAGPSPARMGAEGETVEPDNSPGLNDC